jgi:hypothetical protein
MALTAGTWFGSSQAKIQGASIAPQGNAVTSTLASPTVAESSAASDSLTFGTATGKADIYCAGQFTLAATTAQLFDLYVGTDLKDVQGGTAPFRKLRRFWVRILSGGDSAGLRVGNPGSNGNKLWFGAATDTWTIFPDGPPFPGGSPAGVTVDATHKVVAVENLGAVSVTYELFLAGSSA